MNTGMAASQLKARAPRGERAFLRVKKAAKPLWLFSAILSGSINSLESIRNNNFTTYGFVDILQKVGQYAPSAS